MQDLIRDFTKTRFMENKFTKRFDCVNCGEAIPWSRKFKLYCSPFCREQSSVIRWIRSTISRGVFDEPDVGLGGAIAEKLGQKIFNLSSNVQVLCISHLPQVASFAKNHLLVKKVLNKEESISINSLSTNGRIDEIARMLSGEVLEEEAYSLAKKMIK